MFAALGDALRRLDARCEPWVIRDGRYIARAIAIGFVPAAITMPVLLLFHLWRPEVLSDLSRGRSADELLDISYALSGIVLAPMAETGLLMLIYRTVLNRKYPALYCTLGCGAVSAVAHYFALTKFPIHQTIVFMIYGYQIAVIHRHRGLRSSFAGATISHAVNNATALAALHAASFFVA